MVSSFPWHSGEKKREEMEGGPAGATFEEFAKTLQTVLLSDCSILIADN
jgi:hypothetical protein